MELRHLPHDHILLKICVHNIPEASNVFGLVKFQFEEHVEELRLLKQNKNWCCKIILNEARHKNYVKIEIRTKYEYTWFKQC